MPALIDLTDTTSFPPGSFGRWTVLRRDTADTRREVYWVCLCECGKVATVVGAGLRSGDSRGCKSCGAMGNKNQRPKVTDRRAKQAARLAAGLCRECQTPHLPGLTRCPRHHAIQRAAWTKQNAVRCAAARARTAARWAEQEQRRGQASPR